MIVYESTKEKFLFDVEMDSIANKIYDQYLKLIGKTTEAEIRSWTNSMQYMYKVLNDHNIPNDSGIAIEFKIPYTSKRIDFLLSGKNKKQNNTVIIIELKQWQDVEKVEGKSALVKTIMNGNKVETTHPSYQAWSYATLIEDYNEYVQKESVNLYPCAYLHNYERISNDPLHDDVYNYYLKKAPAFVKGDVLKLRDFISKYIKYGDEGETLYLIENGKIKPSKSLQDSLVGMLKGNTEFIMIDDQKVVYENAINMAKKSYDDSQKRVLIVDGGPGTGKSVLAINLLVNLTNHDMVCQYVTKNATPRNVYATKLNGEFRKNRIYNLFKGSGSYVDARSNEFDALIVDEAHRLNEKSGMFRNMGDNQIKEIIKSSKFSVFFIDENQKIDIYDIGTIEEIKKYAKEQGALCDIMNLSSQFRCNGSDGYIAWIDDVLEIREAANYDGFDMDYDFKIIDNPNELKELIYEKNKINNKARIVAGYCWGWKTENKNNPDIHDIEIPEFNFAMSWNLGNTSTWAIDPESVNQIGCIHTSQGIEFDYIGVVIGNDMRFENGHIITDFKKRAATDTSIKGLKKLFRENPDKALKIADELIKNTYRTLMTRGQKGCYVYCEDKNLAEYLKMRRGKF